MILMNGNMTAQILSVNRLRFGTDGNGIRTLVGFMGCPLRCKYCINPMSWNSTLKGKSLTPMELYNKIKVDSIYFLASGGGVTFGGGEPLLHAEFIKEFIEIAPKEWSFNIETSLSVPFENIELVSSKIDLFIVDIKSMDKDIYNSYTGSYLDLALDNLKKLLKAVGSEKIMVRVPIIECYADEKSQESSVKLLTEMGITKIDTFEYIK